MRRCHAALAPLAALLLSGCGYIHFGRLPAPATSHGDARAAEAYSSLSTEHKILKQELMLARRETDTLRQALERTGGTSAADRTTELATRLSETASELATLRESYARLQAERARSAPPASSSIDASPSLAEKPAAADHAQLQSENARLRSELERARTENAELATQLNTATTRFAEAQAAVSQLNTELLAQKQARVSAEQATDALRAQLSAVMAHSTSTGISALQGAKAPPAGASPTAELRVNTERLRQAEPPPARPARKHTVQAGDTLEKIAQQYYGAPDRWIAIYEANFSSLGGGQPLRAGMELSIPEI